MLNPANINIEEYNYLLPEEKIAVYPLPERDSSKLLFLHSQNVIEEKKFSDLPELLPSNSLLIFNKTKVVNSRLLFRKPTGSVIEIFCLEPVLPVSDFQLAFSQKSPVIWKCLVGNSKRWKTGQLVKQLYIKDIEVTLRVERKEKLSEGTNVLFSWDKDITFSEIIEHSGNIPIPPYLNRKSEESDKTRYQTIFAKNEGSVAAPAAGLHFTQRTLDQLLDLGIETDEVTLHVGAGTFKPVVSQKIAQHEMHVEKVVITKTTLENLLRKINDPIIPVGTTSMRTIESIYWMGVKIKSGNNIFKVEQWDPYLNSDNNISPKASIELLLNYMDYQNINEIKGETKLMIAPGYKFKFAKGLITNFHQPKSTLLLLVSALIGDRWKEAYKYAVNNNFRFLSYGDSCLFLPD